MMILACYDGSADAQAAIDHSELQDSSRNRDSPITLATPPPILAVADELDADVIVLGTRGRGGVKSLMLGSVSRAVLHHAGRGVLVGPSPSLAEQRHDWAEYTQATAVASAATSCTS